jgi:hypothetical protein
VKLFVCHVPRTGGTSLIRSLSSVLGEPVPLEPLVDGHDWLHDATSVYATDPVRAVTDARRRLDDSLPDGPFYRGHLPASVMTGRGGVVVSCVRDPVTRAASAYLFARHLGHIPPTMTAVEFASLPHRRNRQVALTAGSDLVGVFERRDDFLRSVGGLIGRDLPPVRVNVGQSVARDEVANDPTFARHVVAMNRDDFELWRSLHDQ